MSHRYKSFLPPVAMMYLHILFNLTTGASIGAAVYTVYLYKEANNVRAAPPPPPCMSTSYISAAKDIPHDTIRLD